LPSFLSKKRQKARVETPRQNEEKNLTFKWARKMWKWGGKNTLFPCFRYILSFINFFHSFYLISISPLLPLFLLLSSNLSPSLDEYYGKNSQFYFWSSDWNIACQYATKFRVVSLAFMHGLCITQHIGRALWFCSPLRTVRSWPQFAIPARDRVETEAYGSRIH
jgi:hypothetical protein